MNTRVLTSTLLSVFFFLPALSLGWEGTKDNKSIAELQLMNERELANQAGNVCMVGAVSRQHPQLVSVYSDAVKYIQTIGLVARQKNDGKDPDWVAQMMNAAGGDATACGNIQMQVSDDYFKKERLRIEQEEKKIPAPKGKKK